jgi:hypothetical protein
MVVFYRLSHAPENIRDPIDGHQVTVYKLTVSILSKLSENMRHIDRQHYYLAIKAEDPSALSAED